MNDNSLFPDVREHASLSDAPLRAHAPVDWGAACPISRERKPLTQTRKNHWT